MMTEKTKPVKVGEWKTIPKTQTEKFGESVETLSKAEENLYANYIVR